MRQRKGAQGITVTEGCSTLNSVAAPKAVRSLYDRRCIRAADLRVHNVGRTPRSCE